LATLERVLKSHCQEMRERVEKGKGKGKGKRKGKGRGRRRKT